MMAIERIHGRNFHQPVRPVADSARAKQATLVLKNYKLLESLMTKLFNSMEQDNSYNALAANMSYLNVAYKTIELLRAMGEDTQILETFFVRAKLELMGNYFSRLEEDPAVKEHALSLIENIADTGRAVSISKQKYANEGYMRLRRGRIALIRELVDYVDKWGLFDGQTADISLYCDREMERLSFLRPPDSVRAQTEALRFVSHLDNDQPYIMATELNPEEASDIAALKGEEEIAVSNLNKQWQESIREFFLRPENRSVRKLIIAANMCWKKLSDEQKIVTADILAIEGLAFNFDSILVDMPEVLVAQAEGKLLSLITALFDIRIVLRIGTGIEIRHEENPVLAEWATIPAAARQHALDEVKGLWPGLPSNQLEYLLRNAPSLDMILANKQVPSGFVDRVRQAYVEMKAQALLPSQKDEPTQSGPVMIDEGRSFVCGQMRYLIVKRGEDYYLQRGVEAYLDGKNIFYADPQAEKFIEIPAQDQFGFFIVSESNGLIIISHDPGRVSFSLVDESPWDQPRIFDQE